MNCRILVINTIHLVNPGNLINPVYISLLIKYHTPYPTPATTPTSSTATAIITNLNFLYRLLSGGANDACGKYGGGVWVAIT
jgi:hypothetical protein